MNLQRAPHSCCNQQRVRKGLWTPEEDEKLFQYLINHGRPCWNKVPERAGLERCGQSCRLRWINYLKPGIKRGNISPDEEILIVRLHSALGNRWSDIAKHLPGRTYNEIKNYWNSTIKKKIKTIPGYIEGMEMIPIKLPQPVYCSTELNLANEEMVTNTPSNQTDSSSSSSIFMSNANLMDGLTNSTILGMPPTSTAEAVATVRAPNAEQGQLGMFENQSVSQGHASFPNDLPPPTLDTSSCYLPVLESVEAMAPMEAQALAVEKDRVLDWDFLEMLDMNEWDDFPSCSSFAHRGQPSHDPHISGKGNSGIAYWGQPIDPQIPSEGGLRIDPQMSENGSSGLAHGGEPFVPQISGEGSTSSFACWDQRIDPHMSGEGSFTFPGWSQTIDPLMFGEGIAPASSTAASGLYPFPLHYKLCGSAAVAHSDTQFHVGLQTTGDSKGLLS